MKSIRNKTSLILDLFFCIVLMPVLVMLGPARYWINQWPLFSVTVFAWLYLCYFVISRLNIPKLLINRQYWKIGAIAGTIALVTCLISFYPLPDMDFVTPALSEYQTRVRNFGVSITLWLMFSIVTGYSLTISFVKELYEQLIANRRAEEERNKAELAMFKAQISPHFLFNTLNSLYSLVIGTSEKAENAFIKFTYILRYTYVTLQKEHVTLAEEVSYISNYIDLQKLRLNEHTDIVWEFKTDNPEAVVPPMLMLTFVENAFKYGVSTSRDCRVEIRLTLTDGNLHFTTRNSVMKHQEEFRKDMPVGVANSRSRLKLLYPGKHSLETGETDGVFCVDLTINLYGDETGKDVIVKNG